MTRRNTITAADLQTLADWADAHRAYMVHFGACDDCDRVLCEEGMRLDTLCRRERDAAYAVVQALRATDSPAAAGERLTAAAHVQAAGGVCDGDPGWEEFQEAIVEMRAADGDSLT